MSTDFAELAVRADSTPLKTVARDMQAVGAAGVQAQRQTTTATAAMATGYRNVGQAARSSAHGLRNLGLQLGQVAQQGAVTGNYIQALAVQMPDILLSFGMWGIALGVVAGAMAPLVSGLGGVGSSADQVQASIDTLNDRIRDTRRAIDDLSADRLIEVFGRVSASMRELAEARLDLTLRAQADAAGELISAVNSFYSGSGFFNRSRREELFAAFGSMQGRIDEVTGAMRLLGEASTLDEQVMWATHLRAALSDIFGPVAQMTSEQLEFYTAALDSEVALKQLKAAMEEATAATETGADAAARLAAEYQAALDAMSSAARLSATIAMNQARGGGGRADPRMFMNGRGGSSPGRFVYEGPQLVQDASGAWVPRATPTRRGGGGGISEADMERNRAMREAEALYRSTRTAAEEYAAELADINELHSMGYLDADTHARAIAQLTEEYENAGRAGDSWASGMASHFDGLITKGRTLSDVLMSIAGRLETSAWNALFEGFGSGGGGGFWNNLFAGMFDGGGYIPAGKFGIAGERGPEIITGPANVMSRAATAQAMAGGSREPQRIIVSVQPTGEFDARVQGVASNAVEVEGPGMVSRQIGAGAVDKPMARYGMAPTRIRR